jgi:hypothetical protein
LNADFDLAFSNSITWPRPLPVSSANRAWLQPNEGEHCFQARGKILSDKDDGGVPA